MNRSKKLAITLAVFAALGGNVYVQPEQALAANVVIDGDDEFEALEYNDEWTKHYPTNSLFLDKSKSNNIIVFENITTDKWSLAGGRGHEVETSNNTLVIKHSTIGKTTIGKNIYGGFTYKPGGHTGYYEGYNANNNTVIVENSIINANIYGGDSQNGGDAVGNTVIISNSKVEGSIYGGMTLMPGENEDGEFRGSANNNTIIIKENVNLNNARIYGGFVDISKTISGNVNVDESDFRKINNTLTLDGWSGSIQAVRSVDNLNFKNVNLSDFVAKSDKEPGKAILSISGNGNRDSFKNIIGSDEPNKEFGTKDINIGLSFKGGQDINAGEIIRLVQMQENGSAVVDTTEGKIHLVNGTAYAGVAQVLKGELYVQEKYIDYKITDVGLNDQVNVVNEGRAASAAFLNQSDELISEALAGLNLEDKYGFETFAMVYGNDSRYGTNSDLSINGWSGLVGVGSNNKTKAGDFAWAAFFENGAGNYDISTTMNGITMEGDGSTVYNGGGIAARLTGENGVYGEASLRAGLLKNDLENGLLGADNNKYGYESESNYYGMHIGIGKIFKLENGASVDTYAKYYHSTVKDDSFTIDSDRFEMDDINSDRLRLGIRYNQGMDRNFNVYYGAAWEYEFNGESNGYAQGHKMEETSLKGSTVIGELGVVIQPENSPWSFDAKVKGYGGQRDGYSGSILATYHF